MSLYSIAVFKLKNDFNAKKTLCLPIKNVLAPIRPEPKLKEKKNHTEFKKKKF